MPEENDRLIQQLRVEGDAKHTVIIQQQNINTSPNFLGTAGKKRRRVHVMEKMIWDLLAALPDPKLRSLDKLVVAMACEQFGNQKNAAGYLGLSQPRVSQFMANDSDDVKMEVAKSLWNAGKKSVGLPAVRPAIAIEPIEQGEMVAEVSPDEQLMKKLIAEGRILVSEINRNEL